MNSKDILEMLFRYALIIAISYSSLSLFYLVFSPLTIYPVGFLSEILFSNAMWFRGTATIFIGNEYIQLIPACIAGAAYYLLLAINLSTPMNIKRRIMSILFIFISFLIINVLRIILFIYLFVSGYKYFDVTHMAFWYAGSTFFVVGIWFASVKLFSIDNIPFYSDMQKLFLQARK